MIVIGRSGWGALPPNRIAPPLRVGLTVVIHHSATGFARDVLDAKSITLAIQRDHLQRQNPDGSLEFADIAYNTLVGPDCALVGRGLDVQGGATGNGYDDRTVSICVIGNLEENELPAAERRALVWAIRDAWDRFGVTSIEPHSAFYTTTCPGDHMREVLASVEAEAKDDDEMTDTEMHTLARYIIAELMAYPLKLRGDTAAFDYQTNFDGWLAFVHAEAKTIRLKVESGL